MSARSSYCIHPNVFLDSTKDILITILDKTPREVFAHNPKVYKQFVNYKYKVDQVKSLTPSNVGLMFAKKSYLSDYEKVKNKFSSTASDSKILTEYKLYKNAMFNKKVGMIIQSLALQQQGGFIIQLISGIIDFVAGIVIVTGIICFFVLFGIPILIAKAIMSKNTKDMLQDLIKSKNRDIGLDFLITSLVNGMTNRSLKIFSKATESEYTAAIADKSIDWKKYDKETFQILTYLLSISLVATLHDEAKADQTIYDMMSTMFNALEGKTPMEIKKKLDENLKKLCNNNKTMPTTLTQEIVSKVYKKIEASFNKFKGEFVHDFIDMTNQYYKNCRTIFFKASDKFNSIYLTIKAPSPPKLIPRVPSPPLKLIKAPSRTRSPAAQSPPSKKASPIVKKKKTSKAAELRKMVGMFEKVFENGNDGYMKFSKVNIYNDSTKFRIVVMGENEEMTITVLGKKVKKFDFGSEFDDIDVTKIIKYIQKNIDMYKNTMFTIESSCSNDDHDCKEWNEIVINNTFKYMMENVCNVPPENIKVVHE
jgi:hypothetical protein